jgi:CheY-like chemotaxis protein
MQKNIRCLLIDDDTDDQEIFSMALESCAYTVELATAGNGIEALEKVDPASGYIPDIIFLDLNMPLMSGKECLEKMRKMDHLQQVPVIIYSTSSIEQDQEDTRLLGAQDFLVKSPKISELTARLDSYFAGLKD